MGVTAQRVIDRLCVPEGGRASSWTTERRNGFMFHAGFAPLFSGYEFVAALGAWEPGSLIRLLPDGGEWPYSFSLAADSERAMIDYCEGDVAVRVYDDEGSYWQALAEHAEGRAA